MLLSATRNFALLATSALEWFQSNSVTEVVSFNKRKKKKKKNKMRKIYVSRVSVPHTSMLLTVKYAKALLKKN